MTRGWDMGASGRRTRGALQKDQLQLHRSVHARNIVGERPFCLADETPGDA
jgi:hypothetical protein